MCLVSLSIVRGLISLLHCHHREEQKRHLADVWRALLPNSSMFVSERLCYSWPLSFSVEFVYCTAEAAEKKHIKHKNLGT